MIEKILKGKLEYDANVDGYTVAEGRYMVQFQDRVSMIRQFINGKFKLKSTESKTWARLWKDNELIFQTEMPKYLARQKMVQFLRGEM